MNTKHSTQVAATSDYAAMNIQDLIKMSEKNNAILQEMMKQTEAINAAIRAKKQEMLDSIRSQMKAYGITTEELSPRLPSTTPAVEEKSIPTVPETIQVAPKDVFDDPALKAKFIPKAAQKKSVVAPKPVVETPATPVSEDKTWCMEDMLSDSPEYMEYYQGKPSIKKNSKKRLHMESALSGEPIKQIICMGNTVEKGGPYRQNGRLNHADGIIPTEMASGPTGIYID